MKLGTKILDRTDKHSSKTVISCNHNMYLSIFLGIKVLADLTLILNISMDAFISSLVGSYRILL